jgi:arsenate reductase
MAEALLRKRGGDRFDVTSAGLEPTEVHPSTRTVLSEIGIDASPLYAKSVNDYLAKVSVRHAIIVCAQAEAHCPKIYPFARARRCIGPSTTRQRLPIHRKA